MSRPRLLRAIALSLAVLAVAVLGPRLVRAAQPGEKVVRLGFVGASSPSTAPKGLTAFWERLRELGYVEGQNLVVERRWADGRLDRLPALMAEVVERRVDVIFTSGTPAAIAAKSATSTIPIVVAAMGDPLGTRLVASLTRPGGNLTGLSLEATGELTGKWLEILQETVPRLSTLAVISNPDSTLIQKVAKHLEAAARTRSVKLRFIEVRTPGALESAFKQARREAQAVLVLPDPLTTTSRNEITALAARHRLPAMYTILDFMDSGGLVAYGLDSAVLNRRAADYVDRILKGARPADLPIEQPTQYRLVVDLKTAKALGLTIPESILIRADEVIR
jgi:putative ABC transport system substrate-binding protein